MTWPTHTHRQTSACAIPPQYIKPPFISLPLPKYSACSFPVDFCTKCNKSSSPCLKLNVSLSCSEFWEGSQKLAWNCWDSSNINKQTNQDLSWQKIRTARVSESDQMLLICLTSRMRIKLPSKASLPTLISQVTVEKGVKGCIIKTQEFKCGLVVLQFWSPHSPKILALGFPVLARQCPPFKGKAPYWVASAVWQVTVPSSLLKSIS